jgi:hypothetical protein
MKIQVHVLLEVGQPLTCDLIGKFNICNIQDKRISILQFKVIIIAQWSFHIGLKKYETYKNERKVRKLIGNLVAIDHFPTRFL